jgi:hypothetical protein
MYRGRTSVVNNNNKKKKGESKVELEGSPEQSGMEMDRK